GRILTLAGAVRVDDRITALTLTDRTASLAADPVAFAPEVMEHVQSSPLLHLAGKARDERNLVEALRGCEAAGVGSVLLTGGDAVVEQSEAPERAGVRAERDTGAGGRSPGARDSIDAVE